MDLLGLPNIVDNFISTEQSDICMVCKISPDGLEKLVKVYNNQSADEKTKINDFLKPYL